MPPPATSSQASPLNASTTSPSSDNPSSSRLSKDSEGYPSWLPKRPPPPPPASTFQSSMIGGFHDMTPSPVDTPPFLGGRKPTPRSVRIVSLEDSFVGAVEKETRFSREPTDQTRVGVYRPPKVLTRASAIPATAFSASEHDEILPLPQPRFNAKNLHLQLLRNPSKWMKVYFYLWPLLVLYHIPLQSFFDFNAVFMLLQVSKFPTLQSSGRNWALGAAAYIACWLVWIFVIFLVYELVYSFARRWRLRRPLMLPIYLSSSAFNFVAMTSYTRFSFLQHLRFSAFFPEPTATLESASDADYDPDEYYDGLQNPWRSGVAETCFFYAQNLPTVALLLPRAALSMSLLFAFSKPPVSTDITTPSVSMRDQTFFRPDGSLTDYARGVLFANAAWTAWRLLVLIASWLGLWIMSKQRLAGLCGPRHTWEESDQEKSRSFYSEAVSEYAAYRSSFYHDGTGAGGDGAMDYAGDELAWEWREATRMRVQDAFEFCLTSGRRGSGTSGAAGLRWSSVSSGITYGFGNRNRRYMERHRRRRSTKGKEPSNEKSEFATEDAAVCDEGFEGIEKVLAAVGFPNTASPSRRGVLSEDLFAAPASVLATQRESQKLEYSMIEPLRYLHEEPGPSTGMFTGLDAPKMAKRNSKDKVPGSVGGAPLLNLPYPFSKPGTGQVSSNDSVPFPAGGSAKPGSKKSKGSESATGSKSGTSQSKSTTSGSESASGSEEDDEEEEEDEEDEFDSEEPSEPASGSMSSLGQPINSPSRYPFGTRRPGGLGHGRSPSGVSSGISSGAGVSGGSHAHSHSMSSSHGTKSVMGVSVLSHSTGNKESTDSEAGAVEGRSLSHGSSPLGGGGGIPMPPRHPHPHGQGRGRSGAAPSSTAASAAAALAGVGSLHTTPIAFPTVHRQRRRADSGRGIMVDPALLYGSDIEEHELNDDDLDELPDDDDLVGENDNEDEQGEQEDCVGLLGVPSSPLASHSRISLSASHSSSSGSVETRSRTHSSFSVHSSRSRHSSTRARARSRTHSTKGPSVRERASSLGTSMRSLMQNTAESLAQLDLIMRGATGPAAGLGIGSRPRSRVNSSMTRLEEDVVFSPSSAPATEMNERRVSGGSSGNESHSGNVEMILSPIVGRLKQELEEGYSSGGTHSRSGSESVSAENHTFGRPVLFMRSVQEQQDRRQHLVETDENEVVLVERSQRSSLNSTIPTLSMTRDQDNKGEPASISTSVSQSFYSQATTESTASPGRGTPLPTHRSSSTSFSNSGEHSPERQGLAIPWNQQQRLLVPPLQRWEQPMHDAAAASGSSSSSPPGISTAAQSFVTAAPTMEGGTTRSDSSGRHTVSSWEGGAAIGGVRLSDVGGMVERPGEDMGASASGWRVV